MTPKELAELKSAPCEKYLNFARSKLDFWGIVSFSDLPKVLENAMLTEEESCDFASLPPDAMVAVVTAIIEQQPLASFLYFPVIEAPAARSQLFPLVLNKFLTYKGKEAGEGLKIYLDTFLKKAMHQAEFAALPLWINQVDTSSENYSVVIDSIIAIIREKIQTANLENEVFWRFLNDVKLPNEKRLALLDAFMVKEPTLSTQEQALVVTWCKKNPQDISPAIAKKLLPMCSSVDSIERITVFPYLNQDAIFQLLKPIKQETFIEHLPEIESVAKTTPGIAENYRIVLQFLVENILLLKENNPSKSATLLKAKLKAKLKGTESSAAVLTPYMAWEMLRNPEILLALSTFNQKEKKKMITDYDVFYDMLSFIFETAATALDKNDPAAIEQVTMTFLDHFAENPTNICTILDALRNVFPKKKDLHPTEGKKLAGKFLDFIENNLLDQALMNDRQNKDNIIHELGMAGLLGNVDHHLSSSSSLSFEKRIDSILSRLKDQESIYVPMSFVLNLDDIEKAAKRLSKLSVISNSSHQTVGEKEKMYARWLSESKGGSKRIIDILFCSTDKDDIQHNVDFFKGLFDYCYRKLDKGDLWLANYVAEFFKRFNEIKDKSNGPAIIASFIQNISRDTQQRCSLTQEQVEQLIVHWPAPWPIAIVGRQVKPSELTQARTKEVDLLDADKQIRTIVAVMNNPRPDPRSTSTPTVLDLLSDEPSLLGAMFLYLANATHIDATLKSNIQKAVLDKILRTEKTADQKIFLEKISDLIINPDNYRKINISVNPNSILKLMFNSDKKDERDLGLNLLRLLDNIHQANPENHMGFIALLLSLCPQINSEPKVPEKISKFLTSDAVIKEISPELFSQIFELVPLNASLNDRQSIAFNLFHNYPEFFGRFFPCLGNYLFKEDCMDFYLAEKEKTTSPFDPEGQIAFTLIRKEGIYTDPVFLEKYKDKYKETIFEAFEKTGFVNVVETLKSFSDELAQKKAVTLFLETSASSASAEEYFDALSLILSQIKPTSMLFKPLLNAYDFYKEAGKSTHPELEKKILLLLLQKHESYADVERLNEWREKVQPVEALESLATGLNTLPILPSDTNGEEIKQMLQSSENFFPLLIEWLKEPVNIENVQPLILSRFLGLLLSEDRYIIWEEHCRISSAQRDKLEAAISDNKKDELIEFIAEAGKKRSLSQKEFSLLTQEKIPRKRLLDYCTRHQSENVEDFYPQLFVCSDFTKTVLQKRIDILHGLNAIEKDTTRFNEEEKIAQKAIFDTELERYRETILAQLKFIHANASQFPGINSEKLKEIWDSYKDLVFQGYAKDNEILTTFFHIWVKHHFTKDAATQIKLFALLTQFFDVGSDDAGARIRANQQTKEWMELDYPNAEANAYIPDLLIAFRVLYCGQEKNQELLQQWDIANLPTEIIKRIPASIREEWFKNSEYIPDIGARWDVITQGIDLRKVISDFLKEQLDKIYFTQGLKLFDLDLKAKETLLAELRKVYRNNQDARARFIKTFRYSLELELQDTWFATQPGFAELFTKEEFLEELEFYLTLPEKPQSLGQVLYMVYETRFKNEQNFTPENSKTIEDFIETFIGTSTVKLSDVYDVDGNKINSPIKAKILVAKVSSTDWKWNDEGNNLGNWTSFLREYVQGLKIMDDTWSKVIDNAVVHVEDQNAPDYGFWNAVLEADVKNGGIIEQIWRCAKEGEYDKALKLYDKIPKATRNHTLILKKLVEDIATERDLEIHVSHGYITSKEARKLAFQYYYPNGIWKTVCLYFGFWQYYSNGRMKSKASPYGVAVAKGTEALPEVNALSVKPASVIPPPVGVVSPSSEVAGLPVAVVVESVADKIQRLKTMLETYESDYPKIFDRHTPENFLGKLGKQIDRMRELAKDICRILPSRKEELENLSKILQKIHDLAHSTSDRKSYTSEADQNYIIWTENCLKKNVDNALKTLLRDVHEQLKNNRGIVSPDVYFVNKPLPYSVPPPTEEENKKYVDMVAGLKEALVANANIDCESLNKNIRKQIDEKGFQCSNDVQKILKQYSDKQEWINKKSTNRETDIKELAKEVWRAVAVFYMDNIIQSCKETYANNPTVYRYLSYELPHFMTKFNALKEGKLSKKNQQELEQELKELRRIQTEVLSSDVIKTIQDTLKSAIDVSEEPIIKHYQQKVENLRDIDDEAIRHVRYKEICHQLRFGAEYSGVGNQARLELSRRVVEAENLSEGANHSIYAAKCLAEVVCAEARRKNVPYVLEEGYLTVAGSLEKQRAVFSENSEAQVREVGQRTEYDLQGKYLERKGVPSARQEYRQTEKDLRGVREQQDEALEESAQIETLEVFKEKQKVLLEDLKINKGDIAEFESPHLKKVADIFNKMKNADTALISWALPKEEQDSMVRKPSGSRFRFMSSNDLPAQLKAQKADCLTKINAIKDPETPSHDLLANYAFSSIQLALLGEVTEKYDVEVLGNKTESEVETSALLCNVFYCFNDGEIWKCFIKTPQGAAVFLGPIDALGTLPTLNKKKKLCQQDKKNIIDMIERAEGGCTRIGLELANTSILLKKKNYKFGESTSDSFLDELIKRNTDLVEAYNTAKSSFTAEENISESEQETKVRILGALARANKLTLDVYNKIRETFAIDDPCLLQRTRILSNNQCVIQQQFEDWKTALDEGMPLEHVDVQLLHGDNTSVKENTVYLFLEDNVVRYCITKKECDLLIIPDTEDEDAKITIPQRFTLGFILKGKQLFYYDPMAEQPMRPLQAIEGGEKELQDFLTNIQGEPKNATHKVKLTSMNLEALTPLLADSEDIPDNFIRISKSGDLFSQTDRLTNPVVAAKVRNCFSKPDAGPNVRTLLPTLTKADKIAILNIVQNTKGLKKKVDQQLQLFQATQKLLTPSASEKLTQQAGKNGPVYNKIYPLIFFPKNKGKVPIDKINRPIDVSQNIPYIPNNEKAYS